MPDKYHTEWQFRNFVTDIRIFKGQQQTFHFLSGMASDLDNAIEMLEGIKRLSVMCLQLELMKRKVFYLKTANSVGSLWCTK